jgi:hypothetical protein
MRKIYFVFALCVLTLSCKNDSKSTETETETASQYETFSGMFLYLESEKAAVFQAAGNQMYGVVVDDQMLALNEKCKTYKKQDHDMIPVVIKGIKKANTVENAWKEVIEVKEIISVQKPRNGEDGTIIIKNNQ